MLRLYGRAAASILPGASRLPLLPGGDGPIPELTLTLADVPVDPARLAVYRQVCGYPSAEVVPTAYPHVLAFPLHMALMTDPAFPFPVVGLVHVENEISQHRTLEAGERLAVAVTASRPRAHPRGLTFDLLTTARAEGRVVWQERSRMLHRQSGTEVHTGVGSHRAEPSPEDLPGGSGSIEAQWRAPADIGRRYGSVSGDRNPIHMSRLSARALGFPKAIAHGMWSKARCLAALEQQLPAQTTVSVSFRRPVMLPATVRFHSSQQRDGTLEFRLAGEAGGGLHLWGRAAPMAEELAR